MKVYFKMNTRWILLVSAVCLSTVTVQLGALFSSIQDLATKEVGTVVEPVLETGVAVVFSQCKLLKELVGEDYESYNNKTEPNLTELKLDFISKNVNVSYNLTVDPALILQSAWFNPQKPLKIFSHGFTDDPSMDNFERLNTAFMNQGDSNIMALDASSLIGSMFLRSTTMVQFIGQELGRLLAAFYDADLQPSNMHLIGHSLGSHIVGFAGKTFLKLTGKRVDRITGLDPAGPCFADVNVTARLNSNDADFVDVIHTDAGIKGLDERVGHVDYYPNSGSNQPNCQPTIQHSCSHARAVSLFAASVEDPQIFVSVSCADWQAFRNRQCNNSDLSLMGYGALPGTTGTYYLQTSGESPFGLGEKGIQYVNNEGIVGNIGNLVGGLL